MSGWCERIIVFVSLNFEIYTDSSSCSVALRLLVRDGVWESDSDYSMSCYYSVLFILFIL